MRTLSLSTALMLVLLLVGCTNTQPGRSNGTASGEGAVTDPPFTAQTRFAAGQLAESQNNAPDAIAQYQESLKLQPDHLGALYRLAVVYAQLKQYPQAIDTWQRYIKATDDSATAYADLGFCQELAGEPEKAENAYLAGIGRDTKNVPCRVNYGLLLARKGRINDATTQWRFVLTEAEIHYNLGEIYSQQGRKEQAKLEFNKALELDPKLIDARTKMAALEDVQ